MNCVELFAGAGGAALGLEAAGISHLACIEYDADACATLRAAGLPCVEGDVRDPDLYLPEWVGCDLLWSSFPCQAWSSAGKREGAKDERNGWPWTVDAIDRLEPEWFAAENVTGLLQHKGGCASRCLGPEDCPRAYFDNVILAQLRERFRWVGFRVLNASSFGVPQHRRRVIIIAGPHAIDWPEPTHGKPSGQGDLFGRSLLPWATVDAALGLSSMFARSHGAQGVAQVSVNTPSPTVLGPSPGGYDRLRTDTHIRTEMSGALAQCVSRPSPSVTHSGNQYLYQGDPGKRVSGESLSGARVIGGGRNPQSAADAHLRSYRDLTDEPCTTIAAEQIGNAGPWVEYRRGRDGGARYERHPVTEPACALRGSEGGSTQPFLTEPAARRRLTVEECATLQDFPVGHPFQGNKGSQYRQVGNAVPPTLARVVGEAIKKSRRP